jgi:hypothetical protein
MDVDELLALDRELTSEELEFLERESLANAHELQDILEDMITAKMETDAPELTERLRASVSRMVDSLEIAASIPLE